MSHILFSFFLSLVSNLKCKIATKRSITRPGIGKLQVGWKTYTTFSISWISTMVAGFVWFFPYSLNCFDMQSVLRVLNKHDKITSLSYKCQIQGGERGPSSPKSFQNFILLRIFLSKQIFRTLSSIHPPPNLSLCATLSIININIES